MCTQRTIIGLRSGPSLASVSLLPGMRSTSPSPWVIVNSLNLRINLYLFRNYPACSEDLGRSWTRHSQVLTVGTRPVSPAWAGIGDFDIVWDWQHER